MKKHILILSFFLTTILFGQTGSLIHEIQLLPGGETNDLYYSFRIPFNRLVFEKSDNGFLSQYDVMIELGDSAGNVLERKIETKNVTAVKFEETNSDKVYSEGLLIFKAPFGKLKIFAVFTDRKSGKEFRLPEKEIINTPPGESLFIKPLIVYTDRIHCDKDSYYRLANFEGNLPFSEEQFDIIIPATGAPDQIKVEITREDSTYWLGNVSLKSTDKFSLRECGGIVMVTDKGTEATTNFILSGVSGLFPEGVYSLKVSTSDSDLKIFELVVKWYNRPISLSDPEYAIEALKYISDEKAINELLSSKSSEYRKVLNKYWETTDPTPNTQFNPLMNEFYERIDYAARNFSSFIKKDGVKSDRGMVFIKYGPPGKVERSYTSNGQTIETWLYQKNKFIFVDEKGTGEFLLISG